LDEAFRLGVVLSDYRSETEWSRVNREAAGKPVKVATALTRVGYRHILLDARAGTVQFDRLGVGLDRGVTGKGYAVGTPPAGPRGWPVELKDPRDRDHAVAKVFLKDESLSTSGGYEKFFRAEGRTYVRDVDPRTGYPARGSVAVSVIARRTIDSEVWAKPYFVNGRPWVAQHKPKEFRVFFCEDRTDQPCAWLQ